MIGSCSDNIAFNDVEISIGQWPDEKDTMHLGLFEEKIKQYNKQYPDVKITGDTYVYSVDSFFDKAEKNDLPTLYFTWFTEIEKIIKRGYAADVTEEMSKYGYAQSMNPTLLELLTDDNGRIYGLPYNVYVEGLAINRDLFIQAGLVNDDGSIKIPTTYQQLAEYAQIIHDKTGKAGFLFSTTDNCAGWNFMNIAWSYGVNFMEMKKDGKFVSTFDSEECVEAMKYIYDLRWNKNGFLVRDDLNDINTKRAFAAGEGAMMFSALDNLNAYQELGMKKDIIVFARVPEGPKGRYAQMGGTVIMIAQNTTKKQIDAAFKWVQMHILPPDTAESYQKDTSKGYTEPLSVWINRQKKIPDTDLLENNSDYLSFKDVRIKPEEAVCCQELYSVLDECIWEIMTNPDANIENLVYNANIKFQTEYLDKM